MFSRIRAIGIVVVCSFLTLIPASGKAKPGPFVFTQNAAPPVQENVAVQYDRLTQGSEAKLLIGKKVKDAQGRNAGKISDLIVDLETGRVLAAVMALGRDYRVLPAPAFAVAFQDRLELNKNVDLVQRAPRVGEAEDARQPETIQEAFEIFSISSPAVSRPVLASQCFRQKVTSSDNVALGYIHDMVVDLGAGRIIYAIVVPSVGPDPQENLYVAPGRAFRWGSGGLSLKATKEHFLESRVVSRQFPTDMVLPELARDIYNHYP